GPLTERRRTAHHAVGSAHGTEYRKPAPGYNRLHSDAPGRSVRLTQWRCSHILNAALCLVWSACHLTSPAVGRPSRRPVTVGFGRFRDSWSSPRVHGRSTPSFPVRIRSQPTHDE